LHFNVGATNARSSATAYALTNCVASLIEVRGVALGRTSFKRRIQTTFLVAHEYLTTAYHHRAELRKAIATGRTESMPLAVVQTNRPQITDTLTFIDVETNEIIGLEVDIRRASDQTPSLTRPRPYAYVILPEGQTTADKLRQIGMKVHTLTAPTEATLEEYRIATYKRDTEKTEGVFRQEVTATTETTTRTLPEGTFVVYLHENHPGLAVELLEPEADNSFVSFSIIETSEGQALNVYRYLTPTKL
jgi:hypothetical protein